jgi:hypothetical protein
MVLLTKALSIKNKNLWRQCFLHGHHNWRCMENPTIYGSKIGINMAIMLANSLKKNLLQKEMFLKTINFNYILLQSKFNCIGCWMWESLINLLTPNYNFQKYSTYPSKPFSLFALRMAPLLISNFAYNSIIPRKTMVKADFIENAVWMKGNRAAEIR